MGAGNLTMLMERGGKSGEENPRQDKTVTQTDREETPHPRSTNDQRLTTDTRLTIERHDEITIEQILEKQSRRQRDNITSTHNRFTTIQPDDDEEEIVNEDENDVNANGPIKAFAARGKNLNRKQRMRKRLQLLEAQQLRGNEMQADATTWDGEDDEYDQDESMRDTTTGDGVKDKEWHGTETNTIHTTSNQKRVTFCNGYTVCNNIIATTPPGSSSHGTSPGTNCNCSSKVNHSIVLRRPSSQGRRSCVASSGLSAVIAPASQWPHEGPLYGGEEWEVMSPLEEPPTAKLSTVPRPLCSNAGPQVPYSIQEDVRDHLLASPSTGTSASGYIPGHSRDAMYHPADKRIVEPSQQGALRRYRRDGGTPPIAIPGSTLVRVQPEHQGCGDQGYCANPTFSAVPAECVEDRPTQLCSQQSEGRANRKGRTKREPPSPHIGFRRPVQISTLHSERPAAGFEGGTAKTPPRTLVNSGVEASWSEVPPTPLAGPVCHHTLPKLCSVTTRCGGFAFSSLYLSLLSCKYI